MAFQSAAGYNNLPNGNFSPTIYSKKTLKQFRKTSVAEDIVNNNYFGEISNFGDSVKIMKEPEIQVKRYARGTQVTPQDLEDSDFTLQIDRSNSFAFKVDDIEVMHSHVDFMDLAKNRAGYKISEEYDSDVLGYMSGYERDIDTNVWTARTTAVGTKSQVTADADELLGAHKLDAEAWGGAAGDSIAMGVAGTYVATPLQILNRMSRMLDQKNVDRDARWLVVDPVFLEKLQDEDSKFMNHDYQTSENMTNGKVSAGQVRGFRLYCSNSLPTLGTGAATVDTDGSSANFGIIVAGHDSAVASASQISKTEKFRSQDTFGDIVRGLHLYGRKIIRPEGLIRAAYNINA